MTATLDTLLEEADPEETPRPRLPTPALADGQLAQTQTRRTGCFRRGWYASPSLWWVIFTILCYIWVLACFFKYQKYKWFTTLVSILFVCVISRVVTRLLSSDQLITLCFDSFFFGMPLAMCCLYGSFVVHQTQDCGWFIAVPFTSDVRLVAGSLLACGWVTIFSLAWIALRIDRNADTECDEQARRSFLYRASHIAFRMSELAYRIILAVVLADSTRIGVPLLGICNAWGPPILLGAPYVVFILVYAVILYWANVAPGFSRQGKARDDILAVLVVAITMLGINSVFFLDRPVCRESAARARANIQRLRVVELMLFVVVICYSWVHKFPKNLCNPPFTDYNFGPWVLHWRWWFVAQLVASCAVHYALMYFHPFFKRRLGGPLPDTSGVRLMGRSMSSMESFATMARMGSERPGMCQTLVRLGGFSVVAALTGAIELDDMSYFKHVKVLGEGAYGVVVLTKREDSPESPISRDKHFAMKLVNTAARPGQQALGLRSPSELFEREKGVYQHIWQEPGVPDADLEWLPRRAGHPFIVKLHYYFKCPEDKRFDIVEMQQDGVNVCRPIVHKGSTCFHEGLIMEYCQEGDLANYVLKMSPGGKQATFSEFQTVRRFTAEILLALDFLHRVKHVVYRDLNLANVFIVSRDKEPHVKLGDFGFSKVLGAGDQECSLAGSPYFYAPEMRALHRDGKTLTTTASGHLKLDMFSFGTTIFALAHGVPYLQGHPMCKTSPTQSWDCTCAGCSALAALANRFPTQLGTSCLRDLVRRCVSSDPARRATTKELRAHVLFSGEFDSRNERAGRIDFGELLSKDI